MLDAKTIELVHEYINIAEDDNDDAAGAAALRAVLDENTRIEDEAAALRARLQKLEFVEKSIEDLGMPAIENALSLARGRHAATRKYCHVGGELNTIGGRPRKAFLVNSDLDLALMSFWTNTKIFLRRCIEIEHEYSQSLVYRVLKERFKKI